MILKEFVDGARKLCESVVYIKTPVFYAAIACNQRRSTLEGAGYVASIYHIKDGKIIQSKDRFISEKLDRFTPLTSTEAKEKDVRFK